MRRNKDGGMDGWIMEIGNQEGHENFGEPEGKEETPNLQIAVTFLKTPSPLLLFDGRGCIWNFDLRVFVSLSTPPSQLDEGRGFRPDVDGGEGGSNRLRVPPEHLLVQG